MLLLMTAASTVGGGAAPIVFTALSVGTVTFVAEMADTLEFTELAHSA